MVYEISQQRFFPSNLTLLNSAHQTLQKQKTHLQSDIKRVKLEAHQC